MSIGDDVGMGANGSRVAAVVGAPERHGRAFAGPDPKYLLPLFVVLLTAGIVERAEAKPLKVFVLAGQSNMEGHAKVETFEYIGDDPATAPLLQRMRGADGRPRVCDHVWISYFTGNGTENGEGFGKLTAGYGARSDPAKDGERSARSLPSV